jgi:tripartite-type tricarboxylate transporter receptor subunit TctC
LTKSAVADLCVPAHEINNALANPDFKARLGGMGGVAISGAPSDFEKIVYDETDKWARVANHAGVKLD